MAELVTDSSPEDADPDLHIASRDFSKLEDKHIKVCATLLNCRMYTEHQKIFNVT